MSTPAEMPAPAALPEMLVERTRVLVERLQAQRQLIAQKLDHVPRISSSYPRSKTMQLLARNPQTVASLLGSVVRLFRSR